MNIPRDVQITQADRTVGISQYGLSNQHIPLLQGITLAPERKTGLLKSLGLYTQCIMLKNEQSNPHCLYIWIRSKGTEKMCHLCTLFSIVGNR